MENDAPYTPNRLNIDFVETNLKLSEITLNNSSELIKLISLLNPNEAIGLVNDIILSLKTVIRLVNKIRLLNKSKTVMLNQFKIKQNASTALEILKRVKNNTSKLPANLRVNNDGYIYSILQNIEKVGINLKAL